PLARPRFREARRGARATHVGVNPNEWRNPPLKPGRTIANPGADAPVTLSYDLLQACNLLQAWRPK
ncbi:hypothetical protein, partial [Methylocystis sp.]|uniref:hypothetical protein n=1 Tax=Methylocystis sp. TaxID=1911079 RepID=UPI003DA2B85E